MFIQEIYNWLAPLAFACKFVWTLLQKETTAFRWRSVRKLCAWLCNSSSWWDRNGRSPSALRFTCFSISKTIFLKSMTFLVSINLHKMWQANYFLWKHLSREYESLGNTHCCGSYRPFQLMPCWCSLRMNIARRGWSFGKQPGQWVVEPPKKNMSLVVIIQTRSWHWLNLMEETYD